MKTFGLAVMIAGVLIIYWAFGKVDLLTGQPKPTNPVIPPGYSSGGGSW